LKTVPATLLGSGASTPRRRAPARRASPDDAGRTSACVPHAPSRRPLRPRRVPPEVHAPRRSPCPRRLEPHRPRRHTAPCARRTPGPSAEPAVHTTLEPPWHGDAVHHHSAVILRPSRGYLSVVLLPSARHRASTPPLPPPPVTPSSGRSRCNPSSLAHSLGPIAPPGSRVAQQNILLAVSPEPPRQPPPAAVDPPSRQPLRPNSDHSSTLGELLVEPSRLPGRERRRLAGIGRSRDAPHGQGPNCKVRNRSRVFCVNLRTVCNESYLGFLASWSSAVENP
jgi:hypothetical protein